MYHPTLYQVAERIRVAPTSAPRRLYNRVINRIVCDAGGAMIGIAVGAKSWAKNRVANTRCYARRPELLGYKIKSAARRVGYKLGIVKAKPFNFLDFSEVEDA